MLDEADCDLLVIGGGINGAGIARDGAGRGLRVIVLEAGDIARGTSSASTKLIHGGLRYLEHFEFGLVRESLAERERLWAIAPHIVRPMRFVLPHQDGLRPRWLLRLGLFLYDHIGGRKRLPATRTLDLRRHEAGGPLKPGFRTGFAYSDCWVDDARLVLLNLRDAADRGALVLPHTPATALERDGEIWRVTTHGGRIFRARAIVNAAGPSVLDILRLAHSESYVRTRLVRGSHIVVPRLFDHDFSYFFQLPDGRIFFAIPYERDFTLIGTTDADHDGPPLQVEPDPAEIAYLCDGANRYFGRQIAPSDVRWSFAGVRPLIDDGSGRPEASTRGYRLELSDPAAGPTLLSIFGGKLTTYRHLAENALALLSQRLPDVPLTGWTDSEPLPGGDFPMDGAAGLIARLRERYPFLGEAWSERLIRCYGTKSFDILSDAQAVEDCGRHFGHGLTEREVDHLMAREWAATAEDILWRRTKLGLRFTAEEAEGLAAWMKDKLGEEA
ncbi:MULTISPECIES: glycerol-3-phosphate dehydrogenase [Sphingobium]|uniref:Glycerol-3-phosphate dehydrogenase n=1 Tax=Sphingobium tyrosinilyticum TaxID=2715436 RepID=A0ABV9F2D3_9SPHN|nr:glycerol-3-phosphate dehydrogenase [Sphingobium sp. EP60837]ANI79519.1 Glycerol-3-phosphate dehydrogenase [Sphingobium sp. EP60837]